MKVKESMTHWRVWKRKEGELDHGVQDVVGKTGALCGEQLSVCTIPCKLYRCDAPACLVPCWASEIRDKSSDRFGIISGSCFTSRSGDNMTSKEGVGKSAYSIRTCWLWYLFTTLVPCLKSNAIMAIIDFLSSAQHCRFSGLALKPWDVTAHDSTPSFPLELLVTGGRASLFPCEQYQTVSVQETCQCCPWIRSSLFISLCMLSV